LRRQKNGATPVRSVAPSVMTTALWGPHSATGGTRFRRWGAKRAQGDARVQLPAVGSIALAMQRAHQCLRRNAARPLLIGKVSEPRRDEDAHHVGALRRVADACVHLAIGQKATRQGGCLFRRSFVQPTRHDNTGPPFGYIQRRSAFEGVRDPKRPID